MQKKQRHIVCEIYTVPKESVVTYSNISAIVCYVATVTLCGKYKAARNPNQQICPGLYNSTIIPKIVIPFAASDDFSPAKPSCGRRGKSHNIQNAALVSRVSGRKTSSVADRGDGPEGVMSNKVNTANAPHESVWLINVNKWMQQIRFLVSLQASTFSRRSKKTNGDGQTLTGKSEALSHIHIQGKKKKKHFFFF